MSASSDHEINDYLTGFFPENEKAAQLLRISLKRLLLKRPENFQQQGGNRQFVPDAALAEGLPYIAQWISQAVLRDEKAPDQGWLAKRDIHDMPTRLSHLASFDQAVAMAHKEIRRQGQRDWAHSGNLNPNKKRPYYDAEIVKQWPDGFYVAKMNTKAEAQYDTKHLGNCVGKPTHRHLGQLKNPESWFDYFSLRNAQHIPVATIIVNKKTRHLADCNSSGGVPPDPEIIPYVREFLSSPIADAIEHQGQPRCMLHPPAACTDPYLSSAMQMIGYLAQGDHYLDLLTMPEDTHIRSTLYVDRWPLTLPEGLTVDKDLSLRRYPAHTLPERVTVGGNLDISMSAIACWPKQLHVKGDMQLNDKLRAADKPPGVIIEGALRAPVLQKRDASSARTP